MLLSPTFPSFNTFQSFEIFSLPLAGGDPEFQFRHCDGGKSYLAALQSVQPLHNPFKARPLIDSRISAQQGGRSLEIKESTIRILMKHDWPGNVCELANRLERAAIMSPNGSIDRDVIVSTILCATRICRIRRW